MDRKDDEDSASPPSDKLYIFYKS